MQKILAALAAGVLFGIGLTLSRMIDPSKVLGFLDLAGTWDPSLAFVLAGAVGVSGLGFWLAGRVRPAPLFAEAFQPPAARHIDRHLVAGSALFGIGWGLVGICPGPALAGLVVAPEKIAPFVVAMLVGMAASTVGDFIRARRLQGSEA
jgi:uncharacterized membrane protein YedE/YeeE